MNNVLVFNPFYKYIIKKYIKKYLFLRYNEYFLMLLFGANNDTLSVLIQVLDTRNIYTTFLNTSDVKNFTN